MVTTYFIHTAVNQISEYVYTLQTILFIIINTKKSKRCQRWS